MGWGTGENKHLTTPRKGRSGDPAARADPSLTDSQAVISYTQAPMKRESGRNEGECHGGMPSFQRNSGHDSRAAFTATRQIDDNVRRRHRGATLASLTLNRFAAHRAPVLHRPPPTFGV